MRARGTGSPHCSRPGTSCSNAGSIAAVAAGNKQQQHPQQLPQADEMVARAFGAYDHSGTGLIRVEALSGEPQVATSTNRPSCHKVSSAMYTLVGHMMET